MQRTNKGQMELNDISDLIKSLGKAEKRFFKMMALTEGNETEPLVELFDAIEKETISIEKLEKSSLASGKHQTALYNLILKSLRSFNAESNSNFRIKDEILNLRCLCDKAQYKQCRKMLNSLKRELYEFEEYGFLLKVFDVEKKLIFFEDGKKIKHQPLLIANEEQSVIKKELRLNDYFELFIKLDGRSENVNYVVTEKDLENPLLTASHEILSLKERVFVCYCKQLIYRKLKKDQEELNCEIKRNELFEQHPYLKDHFKNINAFLLI